MKRVLLPILLGLVAFPAGATPRSPLAGAGVTDAPDAQDHAGSVLKDLSAVVARSRAVTVAIESDVASGSGVIVGADGLILTAAHVVGGVDKEVVVITADGRRLEAKSLGLVASTDCAMVRIQEKAGKRPLPYAGLNSTVFLKPGDEVFSLGHPGGYQAERGAVVRFGKVVRLADHAIQSDCALAGGDSGGPLFDAEGHVVAIHSRIGPGPSRNVHVPVAEFVAHWDEMLRGAFVGDAVFVQMPEKGKGFLGLATETREEGGLHVTRVGRKSPAEKAGIIRGDVLISLNGIALTTSEDLRGMLRKMAAGDGLTVEMLRRANPEKRETLRFTLGER